MSRSSIASRLIFAVLAVELLAAILVTLVALAYERHTHFRSFDVMLRGRADSVLGAVQDAEDLGDNVMLDLADLHVPPDDLYEVWDGRGHLLGRSSNWQGSAGIEAPHQNGVYRFQINDRRYRLLRLQGSRIVDPGEPGGGKLRFVTILYASPAERVWSAIWGAVEFYAAGMLLLILITGPLIAWVLHRGLEPLRELAALSGKVSAASWGFSPPASARETTELAPLTHALESVLQRLELAFDQQRRFVSDAAHELKTAVAVVKSSLQLVGMRQRTPEEYRAANDRALTDTERMEEIVGKMLTLARVEAGNTRTEAGLCDLNKSVCSVIDELQTYAAIRQVTVALQRTDDVPVTVNLYPDDCEVLFTNLLINAIQHSPEQSHVAVNIAALDHAAEVTIEDHGEGIAPEALPHVFERFYRGDPSRARATGGSGLGLAIAKAIVEQSGGTIALTSEPGRGVTVLLSLPLSDLGDRLNPEVKLSASSI